MNQKIISSVPWCDDRGKYRVIVMFCQSGVDNGSGGDGGNGAIEFARDGNLEL